MSSPGASVHRDAPPGIPAACRNCGAALSGRFCANCGQAADIHVPSTSELIHEALEGITHSDSRLWRTLWLLWFKPGKLTQEFVAGRRAAFRSPVWQQRLRHGCEVAVRDGGASLLHVAVGAMPKAMFIFLPLIAFLHMLLYWRPRHRYAEHLLFFVHVHAFFFSAMTLVVLLGSAAEAWPGVARATGILGPILLWSLPLYTVVAMKRVFGRGWGRTLLKAFALFAVYMVVLAITVAGVFLYAVLQL
jgi:hypothetical protein